MVLIRSRGRSTLMPNEERETKWYADLEGFIYRAGDVPAGESRLCLIGQDVADVMNDLEARASTVTELREEVERLRGLLRDAMAIAVRHELAVVDTRLKPGKYQDWYDRATKALTTTTPEGPAADGRPARSAAMNDDRDALRKAAVELREEVTQ